MTSLIDIIFLLLLFFMLSSTFTRFSEIDLSSAGSGMGTQAAKPVFLSLAADSLRLNGNEAGFSDIAGMLDTHRIADAPLPVLIALRDDVTAQRLTDLLAALRLLPDLAVTVLEAT